jgi:O-acetyl-ADP-ribose deacetylase (regulator of RNase III)
VEARDRLEVARSLGTPGWIELQRGDITMIAVEAIVNAANAYLAGGGGVDEAIHLAAGPEIDDELRSRYRACPTGSAVLTGPGRLGDHGVRWIVHAVGPIWRGGDDGEEALLRSAYESSFRLAEAAGARSVAFPAISAGIFGYPIDRAATVALGAVQAAVAQAQSIDRVVFVLFSARTFEAFEKALRDLSQKR